VAGAVGVETPVGVVELPMKHSGTVDLPGLPAFRFAGADVRMSGLTDLVVDVKVGVSNPNPFPIPAGLLAYALTLSGQPVAQVDGHQLAAVAAHGDGTISIPVKLSLLGAGRAAASALQGGGAEVRLDGNARLGAIPVPLEVSGTARR
jgi:LEA14-like dessication related protein